MKDNDQRPCGADGAVRGNHGGPLNTKRTRRRWCGLAALLATAAVALGACGPSSGPRSSSRTVASLPTSSRHPGGRSATNDSDGSTTTRPPTGNATRLLDEWASCMRRHGDPGQADPTVDASKVIHITIAPGVQGGYFGYSGEYGTGGPGVHCRAYIDAAQTVLRGGQSQPHATEAQLLKFSECMRANGIADFPDPSGVGISLQMNAGGDLNPSNPKFRSASELCAHRTGVHGVIGGGSPPPGTVELNGASPP